MPSACRSGGFMAVDPFVAPSGRARPTWLPRAELTLAVAVVAPLFIGALSCGGASDFWLLAACGIGAAVGLVAGALAFVDRRGPGGMATVVASVFVGGGWGLLGAVLTLLMTASFSRGRQLR